MVKRLKYGENWCYQCIKCKHSMLGGTGCNLYKCTYEKYDSVHMHLSDEPNEDYNTINMYEEQF